MPVACHVDASDDMWMDMCVDGDFNEETGDRELPPT
jgi:hypothetical protein